MTKSCFQLILLFVAFAPPTLLAQNPLDGIVETFESQQMNRLAVQQKNPGTRIQRFNSDGCSGGMSSTWSYLADVLPEFVDFAGNQPPWEHCCVAHDRHYWRGETEKGFTLREEADAELRQCVKLSGNEQGDEIAAVLGLSKQDVIELIDLTGELMYQAVRIGGAPCTGLPWRWGHGWPACSSDIESETATPI